MTLAGQYGLRQSPAAGSVLFWNQMCGTRMSFPAAAAVGTSRFATETGYCLPAPLLLLVSSLPPATSLLPPPCWLASLSEQNTDPGRSWIHHMCH